LLDVGAASGLAGACSKMDRILKLFVVVVQSLTVTNEDCRTGYNHGYDIL